jgi:predicted membrane protein
MNKKTIKEIITFISCVAIIIDSTYPSIFAGFFIGIIVWIFIQYYTAAKEDEP